MLAKERKSGVAIFQVDNFVMGRIEVTFSGRTLKQILTGKHVILKCSFVEKNTSSKNVYCEFNYEKAGLVRFKDADTTVGGVKLEDGYLFFTANTITSQIQVFVTEKKYTLVFKNINLYDFLREVFCLWKVDISFLTDSFTHGQGASLSMEVPKNVTITSLEPKDFPRECIELPIFSYFYENKFTEFLPWTEDFQITLMQNINEIEFKVVSMCNGYGDSEIFDPVTECLRNIGVSLSEIQPPVDPQISAEIVDELVISLNLIIQDKSVQKLELELSLCDECDECEEKMYREFIPWYSVKIRELLDLAIEDYLNIFSGFCDAGYLKLTIINSSVDDIEFEEHVFEGVSVLHSDLLKLELGVDEFNAQVVFENQEISKTKGSKLNR